LSIHQINKIFQNKGCNIAMSCVLLAAVATFVGGYGFRGCAAQGPSDQEADRGIPVVTVGDMVLTADTIKNEGNRRMEQMSQQYGGFDFPQSMKLTDGEGAVLSMHITQGLALKLAKQQGVDLSDDLVKSKIVENQIASVRSELEQMQRLRPGANEQEFESAYKAASGRSLIDVKRDIEKQVDELAAKPNGKALVQATEAFDLLVEKNKAKYMPTESAVQEDFRTYHFKMIEFRDSKTGAKDAKARADKALADIKAGASFESQMELFVMDKPAKGKKKGDQITDMPKGRLMSDPLLKGLLDLKPGQVSGVIAQGGSLSIYKFINQSIDLPKDYATMKAAYADRKAKSEATKALSEEIKKLDNPTNVVWASEGYHVLHDYLVLGSASKDPDRPKKLRELIQRALKPQADAASSDAAVGTAMVALGEAVEGLSSEEAAKLRVSVLTAYVQQFPEVGAKIDLAEAYVALSDAQNTAPALRDAADSNSAHVDNEGMSNWNRLAKAEKEAVAKKLLKPEDVQFIDAQHADWTKRNNERIAEDKRAADEQKKRDDEAKKLGMPQTPSGTPPKPGAKTPTSKPADAKKPPAGAKKPVGKP
jgi:hypothetical protein